MKKLTNQLFIKRCECIWQDRYDLSKVVYSGMRSKIIIGCPQHGDFDVTATNFTVNKSGCPVCGAQSAKSSEKFIEQCKEKHGDKYDYTETVYTNAREKVKIKCPQHGDFTQFPNSHILNGSGCPACSRVAKPTTKEFINRAKKIHGDKYDYEKTFYKRAIDPVLITCKKHGDFEQLPHNHLSGRGCVSCGKDIFIQKMRMSNEEAKKICIKFGLQLLEYSGNSTDKSTIKCAEHHVWFSSISKIQQGNGCPMCSIPGYNPSKMGYVYMLVSHDGNYMKFGLSNSPKKRIRTLKSCTPFDFVVRGWIAHKGQEAPKVETAFHKKCKSANLKGFDGCSEWFIYDDSVAEIFDLQGLP